MAQPPSQDLTNAIDWTGLTGFNQSMMQGAFVNLTPMAGSGSDGLGLVIYTIDSAVGIPTVPNPGLNNNGKWTRYVWVRILNAADSNSPAAFLYVWNPGTTNDATYLHWSSINVTNTAITASINSIINQLATTTDVASTASSQAAAAVIAAGNATTAATNASSAAATASNAAATAQTTANTAQTTANQALVLAQAGATISKLQPGTVGQRIRTNRAGTSLEYYNKVNTLCYLSEQQNNNVAGQTIAPSAGFVNRVLNTKVDPGNICAMASNQFTPVAGVYRINALTPMYSGSAFAFSSRLFNVTGNAIILYGTSQYAPNGNCTLVSSVTGTFTTDGTQSFALQVGCNQGGVGGEPANNTDTEVYTTIELEQIG